MKSVSLAIVCSTLLVGCASPGGTDSDAVKMVTIVGTVTRTHFGEQHTWPEKGATHTIENWNDVDVAIEQPAEYAGLCPRLRIWTKGLVSYDYLNGKRVHITLPKVFLDQVVVYMNDDQVQIAEEGANKSVDPTPVTASRNSGSHSQD